MENSVNAAPIEGFGPVEIYLLCKAIGVMELFGMDDKETVLIKTGDCIVQEMQATDRLMVGLIQTNIATAAIPTALNAQKGGWK